jgi:hypothetical protein
MLGVALEKTLDELPVFTSDRNLALREAPAVSLLSP